MQEKKDYKFMVMAELAKRKSLREAVKWLDTDLPSGKTPAQLIKDGQSQKAFDFLEKDSAK